ncbi:hypothetical protein PIB30_037061 [Stylosanthes scabra]|uniref:Uncharacterized protein n=1 Tax=Stylosanthes scabra TaxID=79078 RepID=A0ABU6VFI1_9FABA|nr:hypothetical protein [Stylosanthes scabra]
MGGHPTNVIFPRRRRIKAKCSCGIHLLKLIPLAVRIATSAEGGARVPQTPCLGNTIKRELKCPPHERDTEVKGTLSLVAEIVINGNGGESRRNKPRVIPALRKIPEQYNASTFNKTPSNSTHNNQV